MKSFVKEHPGIRTLDQLAIAISNYSSPAAFMLAELHYNHDARAQILAGVVEYLQRVLNDCFGRTENERMLVWAKSVKATDYRDVGVRGFGLAGFQYLRMLAGVQTTKPDVHIRRFVGEVIGRPVSDMQALQLLEEAAALAGLPVREVDGRIWQSRAAG